MHTEALPGWQQLGMQLLFATADCVKLSHSQQQNASLVNGVIMLQPVTALCNALHDHMATHIMEAHRVMT